MNNSYLKEFEIHYYEVNRYQEATPVTILNYLEETAIAHSENVGLGVEKLKSDDIGWVLHKWLLNINHYPTRGELITVETWPTKFERFYANREFRLFSKTNNELIGTATSLWIFFNINKRRPMRIPDEIIAAYGTNPETVAHCPFLSTYPAGSHEVVQEFSVRRSDIDTNEHVNNARYVEWILETIPGEIYDHYMLTALEIDYKRETNYGTTVKASSSQVYKEQNNRYHFIHTITAAGEDKPAAMAKTIWQKRK